MNKKVCILFFVGLIAAIASANTIIKPVSVVLTPSGSQYLQNDPAVHWFDGSGLSDATIVENGHPFVLRHRRVDCLDDHHYPFDQ
ncbi:hypothetical protein [Pontiella sulfatireligans]|uniref:Uncharacterized protein n=1 Tax=Pontiella sulfatireligans TaxID=2750658 RepID=A0A6C2USY0_9BACT|nr:hypothetical protein [Pontiella sulfatireligans]VGO23249.1 hypothetical protein SCARR_05356 [Pontiella sulfatireligans]